MPDATLLRVTVVYAEAARAFLATVQLPAGATLETAIDASGFRREHPEVEICAGRVGVFARRAQLTAVLHDGDRVEIYRPLKVDPKEARRKRAGKQR